MRSAKMIILAVVLILAVGVRGAMADIVLAEDFEGFLPGPVEYPLNWWMDRWTDFVADGIDGISIRNVAETWESGDWAGWSPTFLPILGQIEIDMLIGNSPVVFFSTFGLAGDAGGGASAVVRFQPNGSLALYDYSPFVQAWVETSPGLWAPGEPFTFAIESFSDHRDVYVNDTLVLSGERDSFAVGHPVVNFYFRYGNDLVDSSDTFGPGLLMIDNVVVDGTVIPEPATFTLLALGGLALMRRRRA